MKNGYLMTVCLAATVGCGTGLQTAEADYGYPAPDAVVDPIVAGEEFKAEEENDFISAAETPISTFSVDVDTASYTLMRSDIMEQNRLPSPDSVRVEEYINFFDYQYARPTDERPFRIDLEMADSRFGEEGTKLLRVGLQGRDIPLADLKPTNLVFLIDTSGSMAAENKLPLIKSSLRILVDTLRPSDTISVVAYASASGVVLEPTEVRNREQILSAIENLESGGGTNGEGGIIQAYELAESAKKVDGNNRVIICTDGDFNVGRTGDELFDLVESYREKQISLTSVGFGRGNFKDYTMETIASRSNGNYFYIDTLEEAQRVFKTKLPGTLEVIAADVKLQLEFNPETVDMYRLIGYENRLLNEEDFDNDFVDAGEVGPGHNVTAYYEIRLKSGATNTQLADFRVRYKNRFGEESQLIEQGIKTDASTPFSDATSGFQFGASVVEMAEILRESKHVATPDIDAVIEVAESSSDGSQEQTQLIEIAKVVKSLL